MGTSLISITVKLVEASKFTSEINRSIRGKKERMYAVLSDLIKRQGWKDDALAVVPHYRTFEQGSAKYIEAFITIRTSCPQIATIVKLSMDPV